MLATELGLHVQAFKHTFEISASLLAKHQILYHCNLSSSPFHCSCHVSGAVPRTELFYSIRSQGCRKSLRIMELAVSWGLLSDSHSKLQFILLHNLRFHPFQLIHVPIRSDVPPVQPRFRFLGQPDSHVSTKCRRIRGHYFTSVPSLSLFSPNQ
jgi:hypothetical protein